MNPFVTLEQARRLLAELKAAYDQLPSGCQKAVRDQLTSWAELCATERYGAA